MLPTAGRVVIIINPTSGGANPAAARARIEVAQTAGSSRGDSADVLVTERVGHARELAQTAIQSGARLVMAWGGDGTINEVASALAFSAVPLGIIPAGSGNGLARELGVDPRPAQAIADALAAQPRSIDVGELDGHRFFNVAGIGFDAHVAHQFAGRHRRGLAGYVAVTTKALATYTTRRYRISCNGVTTEHQAVLVSLANSAQFGNGARIAPHAKLDDGLLDLVIVEERSRIATVCRLPRLFTGTIHRARGCTTQPVTTVRFESDQPMRFHVDGEPCQGGTVLQGRVHAGALRLAVK